MHIKPNSAAKLAEFNITFRLEMVLHQDRKRSTTLVNVTMTTSLAVWLATWSLTALRMLRLTDGTSKELLPIRSGYKTSENIERYLGQPQPIDIKVDPRSIWSDN
jgi:hypothetical protein